MKKILFYSFCFFIVSCSSGPKSQEFPPLFPFVISYDGPDNVTNMSHLLDVPAGKDGFIHIEDGHFVNEAGRVWLNATNLTGSANFPSHEQADLLAERLARFGINCVRLHYMDSNYGNFIEEQEQGIFTIDENTQRNLDPEQMDKMDYMIAKFKSKGIYTNINLHVARKLDERDGFIGIDRRPHLDKGVDNFEPRMIDLQKEYAKDLLTHVNPYTKLAYSEDPCVAMVEINNENALIREYHNGTIDKLPEPYSGEFQKQWNEWLHKKYTSLNALCDAWNENESKLSKDFESNSIPTIKYNKENYSKAVHDFYKFLYDVEQRYWMGMYHYVKDELGVKSVVSGTQLRYTSPFLQSEFDYIDIHAYWCHPSPVNPDWKIRNEPAVNSLSIIQGLAIQRIVGKPYTISEYNHPFPNQYGAEGQPLLRAYGRLHGWDGVFQYTYNHRLDFEPTAMTYFFDMIARTDVLAHMPACAAIYLRGDVQESKTSVVGSINHSAYFDSLAISKKVTAGIDFAGLDPQLSLIHKTGVELTEKIEHKTNLTQELPETQKIFISDTRELTWNIEKAGAGYWTVNTANTKLFTGFPEGQTINFDDITLEVGKTRLGWATISLVSKNGNGFGKMGEPANILVTATGLVQNTGMVIEQISDTEIKLSDWGEGPIQAEGVPATLTLPVSSDKIKCYALDTRGDRKKEIPVVRMNDKTSEINLKADYETVWYEIEIL